LAVETVREKIPGRRRFDLRQLDLSQEGGSLFAGLRRVRMSACLAVLGLSSAWAGSNSAPDNADSLPASLPTYLRQLTDIGGIRTMLEQQGIQFTFSSYNDVLANPIGGVKQGFGDDGRFGAIMDADLAKLIGWSGATLHASIHGIYGTQFSATNLDNLMLVSSVEAPPALRLFNLWIEQAFGSGVSLRVGQFTAAQEFVVSQNADLFVNSTFGWPMLNSVDLPSGGPNYPDATLGARLQIIANDHLTIRAAIFDGNPAGPGTGNPVGRDPDGLLFRVSDPPFFIVEAAYAYGQGAPQAPAQDSNQEGDGRAGADGPQRSASSGGGLPGTIKFGAWLNTGSFPDERWNAQAGWIYGVIDHVLWRVPGSQTRGLGFFARSVAAPNDRNEVDIYADAGFAFRGPFSSRPDDIAGIAFAYGRISPDAAAYDRELVAVTGKPMPIENYEAAVELTYRWKLAETWFVQPNLQYIFHPGGNIPNPATPNSNSPIPNAMVLGLRTILRF